MLAVDTSVAVAAFAPWHEAHEVALAAMTDDVRLPAHCGLETFATLTRLPEPFRAPAPVVAEYLTRRFAGHWLPASTEDVIALPGELSALGIAGGAVYDALVAITARSHGAVLRTLDRRAIPTYRATGVEFELL